jgi:tRNA isopentenyl-2-thiomethyl-A-37 hydroxylase MiaE
MQGSTTKHWRIDDVAWDQFDAAKAAPEILPLVKAASLVERNGREYAIYLCRVFAADKAMCDAIRDWAEEEVQHGEALGKWAQLADPAWDFNAARNRFNEGYQLPHDTDGSIRGSRTGELISRCMVETGTSSYYTALADSCQEPVLKQLCRHIAADEFRHYKLFYDHMRRYQAQENIGPARRVFIAAGRIGEGEDDELAYAYHCANEPPTIPYSRARCSAAYLTGAMRFYRFGHVQRGMGMTLKAVGLPTQGRLPRVASRLAWWWLDWRRNRLSRMLDARSSATASA